MLTNEKYCFVFFFVLFTSISVFAEKSPIKFGDVSEEEINLKYYAPDSTADAVILCDYGTTRILIDRTEGGFQVVYEKICRIKIFNKNGYDWATESVFIYNNVNIKEDI